MTDAGLLACGGHISVFWGPIWVCFWYSLLGVLLRVAVIYNYLRQILLCETMVVLTLS